MEPHTQQHMSVWEDHSVPVESPPGVNERNIVLAALLLAAGNISATNQKKVRIIIKIKI